MRKRTMAVRRAAFLSILSAGGLLVACAADEGDPLKAATLDDTAIPGLDAGGSEGGSLPSEGGVLPGNDAQAPDTGAKDASTSLDSGKDTSTPTCTDCPIAVRYMTNTAGSEQNLRPRFDVYNNGTSEQSLTEITVRYWFTSEGSNNLTYDCDYAQVGCANTTGSFVTVAGKATADHYFQLSFSGGSIPAAGHSGEIQTRLHDTGYAVTFTQTNDYSFDGSKTAYAEWDHVTVYRNGTLVYGVEP